MNSTNLRISSLNLELTTLCPFHCPQCYCTFNQPRNMPFDTAKHWIDECHKAQVKTLALSGGETLCYPYLLDVIRYAKERAMFVAAAFSGWGLTEYYIDQLQESGLDVLCISLNGSTEKINGLSRDGYAHAINALTLLAKKDFPNVYLNWVMHSNNADDFPNLLTLAESFHVTLIDIIGFKPDRDNQMLTVPSFEQMESVKKRILSYKGPVKITVEPCYSPFRCFVTDTKLFGCFNTGINRGCRAGQTIASVTVDGFLTPCRHLYFPESYDTLEDYFHNSNIIKQLSDCWNSIDSKCGHCKYLSNCKPCQANNHTLENRFYMGSSTCPINMPE